MTAIAARSPPMLMGDSCGGATAATAAAGCCAAARPRASCWPFSLRCASRPCAASCWAFFHAVQHPACPPPRHRHTPSPQRLIFRPLRSALDLRGLMNRLHCDPSSSVPPHRLFEPRNIIVPGASPDIPARGTAVQARPYVILRRLTVTLRNPVAIPPRAEPQRRATGGGGCGGKIQSLRRGCCCRESSQQHISVLFMLLLEADVGFY
jgi:hypothetical protein